MPWERFLMFFFFFSFSKSHNPCNSVLLGSITANLDNSYKRLIIRTQHKQKCRSFYTQMTVVAEKEGEKLKCPFTIQGKY